MQKASTTGYSLRDFTVAEIRRDPEFAIEFVRIRTKRRRIDPKARAKVSFFAPPGVAAQIRALAIEAGEPVGPFIVTNLVRALRLRTTTPARKEQSAGRTRKGA